MFKSLRTSLVLWLILVSSSALLAAERSPTRWEKTIQAFEAADKTNPPPSHANLFIGSSSIRKWTTLAQDFPDYKVINRGFGGSEMIDSVYFFDRIVKPYQPKTILVYAGSNDINAGVTPEEVFANFTNFVAKTRAALPGTRVAFISIAPNPARWSKTEQFKTANQLIENFAKHEPRVDYIDVFSAMLGKDGKPLPDIYIKDNLHMNEKGYAIWTPIVRKYLKK